MDEETKQMKKQLMEQSTIILPKKMNEIMVVVIRQEYFFFSFSFWNNFTSCLQWVKEIINLFFIDLMAYLNCVEDQVEEV